MAQAGFPWNAQNRDPEPAQLSEKDGRLAVPESKPSANSILTDATNTKLCHVLSSDSKRKTNGSIKRRSDPVKTGATPRQNIRNQLEPQRTRETFQRIPVRTIPAWIQDADEDDLIEAGLLPPENPDSALVAQHNHTPSSLQRPLLSGGYPTSSGGVRREPTSRWISFARASAYPRENFNSEKVEPEWLNENFTDYSKPWLADHNDDDVEDGSDKYRAFRRKRRAWYKRAHFAVMRNPFIPLVFRLFVITFAATGMALGASILHENNILTRCIRQPLGARDAYCAAKVGQEHVDYDREDPSALMAISVDAVAIVYSIYITYDEYFSKPLGLRPAAAKVRLVLLDLVFIVFQSANLSLAFNSIQIDNGPCETGTQPGTQLRFDNVCVTARALSSVLFVSLVAWLLTFSVSILRCVSFPNRWQLLIMTDLLNELIQDKSDQVLLFPWSSLGQIGQRHVL